MSPATLEDVQRMLANKNLPYTPSPNVRGSPRDAHAIEASYRAMQLVLDGAMREGWDVIAANPSSGSGDLRHGWRAEVMVQNMVFMVYAGTFDLPQHIQMTFLGVMIDGVRRFRLSQHDADPTATAHASRPTEAVRREFHRKVVLRSVPLARAIAESHTDEIARAAQLRDHVARLESLGYEFQNYRDAFQKVVGYLSGSPRITLRANGVVEFDAEMSIDEFAAYLAARK